VVTPTEGGDGGEGAGFGDANTVKDDTEAGGSGCAETMETEKGGSAGEGAEGAGAVTVTADWPATTFARTAVKRAKRLLMSVMMNMGESLLGRFSSLPLGSDLIEMI
jgi:phage-related minor tail protein